MSRAIFLSADHRQKLGKQRRPPRCVSRLAQHARGPELSVEEVRPLRGHRHPEAIAPALRRHAQPGPRHIRRPHTAVDLLCVDFLRHPREHSPREWPDGQCDRPLSRGCFLFCHGDTVTQCFRVCQVLRAQYAQLYLRVLRGVGTGYALVAQLRPCGPRAIPSAFQKPGPPGGSAR